MKMKNMFVLAAVSAALVAVLVCSSAARAQSAQSQAKQDASGHSVWKFHPMDRAEGDGGPAPKRDLSGSWAGPGSGMAVPRGSNLERPEAPPLTPLGKQLFDQNKPIGRFSPAGTNDPHTRYCDPFGFPQNMMNESRGMTITTLPGRTLILLEYMNIWREIWTDGRKLPANVGGEGEDAPEPTYNGYSIGRWDDDYTFVVDTTGMDDSTWATKNGYPHTLQAQVRERYHRDAKNDLTLSITMDDAKLYTKPFELAVEHFRWIPNQKLGEFNCIPSQVQEYLSLMGDPAGSDPGAIERGDAQGPAGGAGRPQAGQPQKAK